MKVSIAYSTSKKQLWLNLDVSDGTTVIDAIQQSGILKRYPEIDLETQKIGVFGKMTKPDIALKEGDRVEIYRPITADPKTVKRRDKDEDEDNTD